MEPSHRGRERAKVKTKWLEEVNTYGNNPIKLEAKMKKKKVRKTEKVPGITKGPKTALSSANRPFIIKLTLPLT